jgi:tetratricopeptide (TPR) repeat protein
MVDDEGYHFRHELIRQTVYQGLSKWRAQLLHKRAAQALEALYKINLQVEYGQIAFHYDCAGLAEQAVQAYYAAAQSAQEIYAYQTAINFLKRGIQLLPDVQLEPELIANVYELLGDCQNNIGDFDQARQCYNQSIQSLGESNALLTADLLRKSAATFSGEFAYDQAMPLLDHALDILDEKTENQAVAWQRCWLDVQLERIWVFYLKAVPEKIDEISTQIKPYIEQVGTPRQRIRFYSGLNYAIVRKNRYQVSREVVDSERRSLKIAREADDEVIISECEFNTGILSFLHGDVESAIELLSTGLARAQKLGLHPIELQCCVYLIAVHRVQGNLEAVQEFIPGCLEIADRIGQPNYQGAALTHQGWLHYHCGDYAQAEQSAAKALEFWDATKTYPFQWMGLWLLLAMAFSQGKIDLALQYVARITDPIQQAPPPEIETLLQSALQASKEGQGEKVKSALKSALKLARVQGYL